MTGPSPAAHDSSLTVARRSQEVEFAVIVLVVVTLAALLFGSLPILGHSNPGWPAPSATLLEQAESYPQDRAGAGPTPTWEQVATAGNPPPLYHAAIAYDAQDREVVLFGGETSEPDYLGQPNTGTWAYSNATWTNLSIPGPAWATGGMAYDPADGYIVLPGGCASHVSPYDCNGTWIFDNGKWSDLAIPSPPSGGRDYSLAWDPSAHALIFFGGWSCKDFPTCGPLEVNSGTWSFSNGRWTNLSISGPSARWGASMVYSPAAGGIVLFGGEADSDGAPQGEALGDTWLFNGHWTNLSIAGPQGRVDAQMTVEPTAGEVLLFGGETVWWNRTSYNASDLGDSWLFDGVAWEELSGPSPSARYAGAMVYDVGDGYDLLYGGYPCLGGNCFDPPCPPCTASSLGDTWTFSLGEIAPVTTVRISPETICVVGDLSCAAGTWRAEVNVSIVIVYGNTSTGFPALADPTVSVLPWGEVRVDLSTGSVVSCASSLAAPTSCRDDSTPLVVGGSDGFQVGWNPIPGNDTLFVGDAWSIGFGVTVAGPPFGSIPLYSCTTESRVANGSGPIEGRWSSFEFRPRGELSIENQSLPFANISVDPPQFLPGGSTTPVATTPPTPPPPTGLPAPVTSPPPVTIPVPVLAVLAVSVPTISISAAAAGVLSAGFARVVLRKRAIAQGQPVGSIVKGPRSAFDDSRPGDSELGRFV